MRIFYGVGISCSFMLVACATVTSTAAVPVVLEDKITPMYEDTDFVLPEDAPTLDDMLREQENNFALNPSNDRIALLLARLYAIQAESLLLHQEDKTNIVQALEKSLLHSKTIIHTPHDAQTQFMATYWYTHALGYLVYQQGLSNMVLYAPHVLRTMQDFLPQHSDFYNGGIHRFLGFFYAVAPSFVGGDLKKSREHFEQAMHAYPDFLNNKVAFAQYWATRADDKATFVRVLREVLQADATALPDAVFEQQLAQDAAHVLLDNMENYF